MNVINLIAIFNNKTLRNLFFEEELREMISIMCKETIDYN